MNRRDFVQMLALLGAGAAALPTQVAAFERYYNTNTPIADGPFIAVDEISISGLATHTSTPVDIIWSEHGEHRLSTGINALGGIYFWRAPGDGKIVCLPSELTWKMKLRNELQAFKYKNGEPDDGWVMENLQGHVRYIDSDGFRRSLPITTARGSV